MAAVALKEAQLMEFIILEVVAALVAAAAFLAAVAGLVLLDRGFLVVLAVLTILQVVAVVVAPVPLDKFIPQAELVEMG